ncbi:hypothetical protein [Pseudomonas sp. Q1-7]|uniref:hypothetical protein n=1 Tax=Pseudomonas sp. Q1-7 TaxID=3020843 RepID=UPI002300B743|nr:hypothetical protein [Pseudomonas sp. Q1-7]
MARESAHAIARTRGEKLVTGGWLTLAVAIPVSCIFSDDPFDLSAGLAALSLITLCAAFACWPKLFLGPINYKGLCDELPRGSAIAMTLFVGLTVLRGFVELVA